MKTVAQYEIEKAREEFAQETLTLVQLEGEVEFWLGVDECERCEDDQICSRHHDWLLGFA